MRSHRLHPMPQRAGNSSSRFRFWLCCLRHGFPGPLSLRESGTEAATLCFFVPAQACRLAPPTAEAESSTSKPLLLGEEDLRQLNKSGGLVHASHRPRPRLYAPAYVGPPTATPAARIHGDACSEAYRAPWPAAKKASSSTPVSPSARFFSPCVFLRALGTPPPPNRESGEQSIESEQRHRPSLVRALI